MALKIEKLKAPLLPGPEEEGDTNDWCISIGMKDPYVLVCKRVNTIIVNAENPERRLNTAGHAMIVPLFYVILIMNRDMRFPTMRHVDMCRLRRACTASF